MKPFKKDQKYQRFQTFGRIRIKREREMTHAFHLYEAAVPQPGADLEDRLSREAVERTLKQDAAGGP